MKLYPRSNWYCINSTTRSLLAGIAIIQRRYRSVELPEDILPNSYPHACMATLSSKQSSWNFVLALNVFKRFSSCLEVEVSRVKYSVRTTLVYQVISGDHCDDIIVMTSLCDTPRLTKFTHDPLKVLILNGSYHACTANTSNITFTPNLVAKTTIAFSRIPAQPSSLYNTRIYRPFSKMATFAWKRGSYAF